MKIEYRRQNGNELIAIIQGEMAKKAISLISEGTPHINYGYKAKDYILYNVQHTIVFNLGGITLWLSRGDYFKIITPETVSKKV